MTTRRVALYSPDSAIVYDGRTPETTGVGGGIMARLSMVEALAALGHDVTAYVNCRAPLTHRGVRYEPVADVRAIDADVLVAISTGGALSFAALRDVAVQARRRIVWVQGVPQPADLDAVSPDFVYAASNFLRDVCVERWGLPASRLLVSYNGLRRTIFDQIEADPPARDPHAIAYVGPLEKGYAAAVQILRRLRARDPRFSLLVFGGPALWGQSAEPPPAEPGVAFQGLLGQRDLISALYGCEYLIAPQAMEEGFGIAVQEARRAGLAVVTSAVGAFPELIAPGLDGYLVEAAFDGDESHDRFAEIVMMLAQEPDVRARIQARARQTPWSWTLAADTWTGHWDALDAGITGEWLALADGWHSTTSGYFARDGRPARVLIGGYYGHGNLGDEAILEASIGELRARRPALAVTVASGDPEDTRARHGVDAVHENDWPALIDAAASADLVLLGGGGLLHDHFGVDEVTLLTRDHWGLTASAGFPFLAAAHRKPFMVFGVGVGPLSSRDGQRLARLTVEAADRVTVRDAASRDLLEVVGVGRPDIGVGADPVFALAGRPAGPPADAGDPPRVVVAVREWPSPTGAERWVGPLAAALDEVVEQRRARVVFVPFHVAREAGAGDDIEAAERVRSQMQRAGDAAVERTVRSGTRMRAFLSDAAVVVTLRLHGAILGASAGVPVVALAYDPKVRQVMRSLGIEDLTLDLDALDAPTLAAMVLAVIDGRDQVARRVGAALPALRTAAHRHAVTALELLQNGRQDDQPPADGWAALLARTVLRQTRRATVHEAGVAFLKGELDAARAALAERTAALDAAERRLADRTEDLAAVSGALGALRAEIEWRPEHGYRRFRRNLRRRRRAVTGTAARFIAPPGRLLGRAYQGLVPEAARAAVGRALARPLMSWAAFSFDRFKRSRMATYGRDLSGLRGPGEPGLVTVVLPAYNGASMLREAVDSVLSQTYRRLELVIVDDGSTDETAGIADTYARMDPRVRVIHQTNQKLPLALSRGFEAARGEYLTWTSVDNRLKPTFLERMVACLERHPDWDLAYANLDIIDDEGRPLRQSTFYGPDQHPPGSEHVHLPATTETLNVVANNSVGAAFLYRSRVATVIGPYSPHRFVCEDYDYWMRVNAVGTIRHVDFSDELYEYRFHGASLTSRWVELDMLGSRDRLMVFEDFRRDFWMSPIVWIIEGDATDLVARLRARVERAGHVVFDGRFRLADLPSLGTPVIRAWLTRTPWDAREARGDVPPWALRLLVTDVHDVPVDVNEIWDLSVAVGDPDAGAPGLVPPRRGWIRARDVDGVFLAADIRAKSDQLARIETAAEDPAAPSRRASVVICTRRHTDRLARAIAAVARQTFPPGDFELIVVSNAPGDSTLSDAVLQLRHDVFGGDSDRCRLLVCPFPGLSASRNAALAEARGAVVCFLDDDAIADPDWLAAVSAAFDAHPRTGVVGGHIELAPGLDRPPVVHAGWAKYWSHYVTEFAGYTEVVDWKSFPWGANWSARREALRRIGGFRTQYGRVGSNYWGGEELVAARLIQRLGYAVAIEPSARVVHDVDPTRFTLEHVRRTLPAGYHVGHVALRDGYLPAAASALGAAAMPLLTSHVDRTVPEGRYRWLDLWWRKRAQVGVLGRTLGDVVRRLRTPIARG